MNHMCHIVHIPTTRSLLKTVYLRINQREPVRPGQAALLLSILALSAFFHHPSDQSQMATTEHDAIELARFWCKGALDLLDYSRRTTSGTLEDIQASIIMSLLLHHLDGFSARGRLLFATAASLARDLRLHQLDAEQNSSAENETSVRDRVNREIKRRVFWYIASNDW
jgi:hypothetical protein